MFVSLPSAKQVVVLRIFILALVCIVAFATRLFSVLRFESVIHEFDPYFNYRTTKFLVSEGIYNFHNWFDDYSWYPLGRIIGGTIYPGLMLTAALVHWALNALNFTVNIRNVCVLTAPLFASNTALATYLLGKEVENEKTGLVAAALIAIVPGYISRSVAGSYDNEGVAIFALIFCFFLWVKSVKTGSLFWSAMCALSYFYMVAAWGGYIFIINLIPLYVLVMIFVGRYSHRLYVAYCTLYVLGTLLSMQVSFVGFQPVYSSEHMAALGVFVFLQVYGGIRWISNVLPPDYFRALFRIVFLTVAAAAGVAFVAASVTGYVAPWTGRFYTLLDPTYAKAHIPIIASVSEHQPTTWSSFFFDLHMLTFMLPAGLYYCLKSATDGNIFIVMYGVTSVYFAGVMVRLMLVLSPAACVLSAIAISNALRTHMTHIHSPPADKTTGKKGAADTVVPYQQEISLAIVLGITALLVFYTFHCTWVTSEAYSSPSIVLAARQHDGGRIIFDDFREAYYWLRQNTPEDAKIMSWWDYGYQITAMANRTVIVDNNTWNNSHIALVGMAMASDEEISYKIMRSLDVDYVLVIFGGLVGYASDDINKFLWMVRIAGGEHAEIREEDYFTPQGEFRVDREGSPILLNCLMYKMCYFRFGSILTEHGKPTGYDRVRNTEIGNKDFTLNHLEEAYTTEHWLVRIYKVKSLANRG
eukprot:TRINITY_DN6298_c0_g2_i1.p1 TRINITY_DN6298_c0_g2~~TRINITY_DN6298_c0_g2_i1.p1  ORF type:complete len:698 (+),score=146.06 TRINITY_DN6298_c0_g2_i1:92-2185(+)